MEKYRGKPETVYPTNNPSTRPVSFNGKREPDIEARVCAPEFWIPRADLKQSAKNFAWGLLIFFSSWCLFRGLYVTIQDAKAFLGAM